jgi:DNA-binding transcriptional MocR family regulator
VDRQAGNTMRLSFSAPTPERIEEGVSRLGVALRAEIRASVQMKAPHASRS